MTEPPEGYTIIDRSLFGDKPVKRSDLTYNTATKLWQKAQVERHRALGTVEQYFHVARKEEQV